jgi:hypothetical protein
MLRRDIEKLEEGYTRSFTIYDQDDSVRVVKACIKDLGYDDQRLAARQTQGAISHAKNSGLDADSYAARVESHDEKRAAIARVFRLYEERLVNNNALDFDDLLIKAVRLLRKSEGVRAHYNERFRYILVDEYQDTNALQFALIDFLTQRQQNVCVVGDESQSIYRWRKLLSSNRTTAPLKPSSTRRTPSSSTTPSARTRRSGRPTPPARLSAIIKPRTQRARRASSPPRSKITAAQTPSFAPPSSTEPTHSRASLKKHCGARGWLTTSSAASPSTSAQRCATSSRI